MLAPSSRLSHCLRGVSRKHRRLRWVALNLPSSNSLLSPTRALCTRLTGDGSIVSLRLLTHLESGGAMAMYNVALWIRVSRSRKRGDWRKLTGTHAVRYTFGATWAIETTIGRGCGMAEHPGAKSLGLFLPPPVEQFHVAPWPPVKRTSPNRSASAASSSPSRILVSSAGSPLGLRWPQPRAEAPRRARDSLR